MAGTCCTLQERRIHRYCNLKGLLLDLAGLVSSTILGAVAVGAVVYYGAGFLYAHLKKDELARIAARRSLIALTFDDGPGRTLTLEVLGLLHQYNAKATFFLLGRNAQANPEIVRQIARQGHEIALHGYDHVNAWLALPWTAIRNIERGASVLKSILARPDAHFCYRPANGKLNLIVLLYLWAKKMPVVFWTVDSKDSRDRSRRPDLKALPPISPGVILMHDFERRVQENYDYVLGYLKHVLKTRGNMQVVTTGEMLNRPELCRLSAADKQNVDSSGELQCYSSR